LPALDAQPAGTSGDGHGLDAGMHAHQEWNKEFLRVGRQREPSVVPLGFGLPALGGQE
jgi:hypothetical protein